MDCVEIQKQIQPFIQDELNEQGQKEFIVHLKQCKECREEYDVYYTLLMGMKMLDEEDTISEKFHIDSQDKIRSATEMLSRKKKIRQLNRAVCLLVIAFLVVWLSL